MSDTIFKVELPLLDKDDKKREKLEEIKRMYPKYDPYFIASGCLQERKSKFDDLWKKYRLYADSNFLTQVKTCFHQRTWEMYIGNIFLEKNLKIQSRNEGPDFIIDKTAYVECVAPTKGDSSKPDSVPEEKFGGYNKVMAISEPSDKIILRITQAITGKMDQYKEWKSKKWFDETMPFIIAVNTGDLKFSEYGIPNFHEAMPNVLKALFGVGDQVISIDVETGKALKTDVVNYSYRPSIPKSNDASVSTNCLLDPDLNFVSGVLFSQMTVLNHPDNIGDDCVFVNNPLAAHPVDEAFIELFEHWIATRDNDNVCLHKNPYKNSFPPSAT